MNQESKDGTLSLIQKPKSKVDLLSIKLDPEAAHNLIQSCMYSNSNQHLFFKTVLTDNHE